MQWKLTSLLATAAVSLLLLAATPARGQEGGYLYFDPHPIPYSVLHEFDYDWVDIEGFHYFPFAPDAEEMDFYIIEEGAFIFVGDPTMYDDFGGNEYWYYGPHPIDYYGEEHICYIEGPHVHWYAPTVTWLDWYYYDSHVYVWYGPWPAHYRPHHKVVLLHHYPHRYKHHHKHIHLGKHYKQNPPPKHKPKGHASNPPGHHARKPQFNTGKHKSPRDGQHNGRRYSGSSPGRTPKATQRGQRGENGRAQRANSSERANRHVGNSSRGTRKTPGQRGKYRPTGKRKDSSSSGHVGSTRKKSSKSKRSSARRSKSSGGSRKSVGNHRSSRSSRRPSGHSNRSSSRGRRR